MFDTVLASVGIGAAAVRTRLNRDAARPGEALSTQVVVDGEVDGISVGSRWNSGRSGRTGTSTGRTS